MKKLKSNFTKSTISIVSIFIIAGCIAKPPNKNELEELAPTRTENICPVVRFLVDGRPAEESGYEVRTAMAATQDLLANEGMTMVFKQEFVERFQNKVILERIPLYSDHLSREQASDAVTTASVQDSIWEALRLNMAELGQAELANCEWVLTGQVSVTDARPDPAAPGLFENEAYADLLVVDVHASRTIASSFNPPKSTRDGSELETELGSMSDAVEGAVGRMGGDLRNSPNLYLTLLFSDNTNLVNIEFDQIVQEHGFERRSVIDGADFHKTDWLFRGNSNDASNAMEAALIEINNNPSFRGLDFRVLGKVFYVWLPGTCPPPTIAGDCE